MERRPTFAVIDTEALRFNYRELRKHITGSTRVMAVVKANAYGHGALEAARVFERLGCEYFGVALLEEGAKLREGGIISPIIVLGGIYPNQIEEVFNFDLTPVVFDITTARLLNDAAKKTGVVKNIHIKIDTGMGRIGLLPGQVTAFFSEFKRLTNLRAEAVLSHFVESEAEDREYSKRQLDLFLKTVEEIKALGTTPDFIDMANSAATADYKEAHLGLIRPGIMLYGSYPSPRMKERIKLKPAMQLKTRVLHVKTVPEGATVSYGRRFTARRESVIATLPIGYADGLPRKLSNTGEVIIRGMRAPIAGTVCMDLTMADVTDIPGVAPGDEVVIIGTQGAASITAEEMADKAGTISYEIFCGISSRVPRVYI